MSGYRRKNLGFTLYFSIIIVGLLLVVGVSITSIISKQFELSFFSRESQQAFYAADAAYECILLNELGKTGPPTIEQQFTYAKAASPGTLNVTCNNTDAGGPLPVTANIISSAPGSREWEFDIEFDISGDQCATINFRKNEAQNEGYVTARGYNIDCDSNSGRKVERAIQAILDGIVL